MNFIKKYWYILILLCVTLGLGFITYLTSQQLAKKTPVAPTVPQEEPQAVEPACTLTFTLEVNQPTCNSACQTDNDCAAGYLCSDEGQCRNASCPLQTDCQCSAPTSTPTTTPVPNATSTPTPKATAAPTATPTAAPTVTPTPEPTTTPVPGATNTPTPQPTATPAVPSSCNNICNVTADCESGLTCVDGACRNPSCTAETDCTCNIAQNAAPTEPPAPQVPVSGSPSVLGFTAVAGGILLLLIGLAL